MFGLFRYGERAEGEDFESLWIVGAVNGARTRDPQLGKLMLYQLSYYRRWICKITNDFPDVKIFKGITEGELIGRR